MSSQVTSPGHVTRPTKKVCDRARATLIDKISFVQNLGRQGLLLPDRSLRLTERGLIRSSRGGGLLLTSRVSMFRGLRWPPGIPLAESGPIWSAFFDHFPANKGS